MNTSKESIGKITDHYKTYGPIYKNGGIDLARNGLYGMHTGYRDKDSGVKESASKLMERKMINESNIRDGQRILDAGCGTGTLTFEIASLYPNTKVSGIDILEEHLEIASRYKSNFHNVLFSRQDYLNLAFGDNAFDRVFFCESLVHAQDKNKLLSEAYRTLRPGGKIIIADIFMLNDNLTEKEKLDLSNFNKETGIPDFENLYNFIQKLRLLRFQNISFQDLTDNLSSTIYSEPELNSPNPSILLVENVTLSKLENLLSTVGELFSNRNAGYFIITADIQKKHTPTTSQDNSFKLFLG